MRRVQVKRIPPSAPHGERFSSISGMGEGIPFEKPKLTLTTTIRLDPDDLALARKQPAARGLRSQTYLKMIIHEALRKAEDENKSAAALLSTTNHSAT